jgi:hypothetical protein
MNRAPDRMRIAIMVCIAIAVAVILTLDAKQASAVAPTNDVFAGPLVVPGLPFSEVADTTEATTDADDAQLNTFCGAPATDASVWYAFTPAVDTQVVVDVSGSNYSAGIIVSTGKLAEDLITCGPGAVGFFAAAGTTYYVLAFDDQFDGGGNGGSLSISFNEVQVPTVDLTLSPSGTFNAKTGTALISGTYTCSNGDFLSVSGTASQLTGVGRLATILGFFDFFVSDGCDGESHPWSAEVFPQSGKFKGGKTLTVSFAFSCGPFLCAEGYAEQTVQLRGGGKATTAATTAATPSNQVFLPSIITR